MTVGNVIAGSPSILSVIAGKVIYCPDGVAVAVFVLVDVGVFVLVGVLVEVLVGVFVAVLLAVIVGVLVAVFVLVEVGVFDLVGVGEKLVITADLVTDAADAQVTLLASSPPGCDAVNVQVPAAKIVRIPPLTVQTDGVLDV